MIELETPRLVLRGMCSDDLGFVASMLAHPEVMRFWPAPYPRSEAEAWIRRQVERYARGGYGYRLLLEKATGQPVGQAGLLRQWLDGVEETGLSYMVHRPFWRRGFAAEAAAACLDHAFEVQGEHRVVALIRPDNVPSQGVARSLGMRPEGSTVYAGFEHTVYAVYRESGAGGRRPGASPPRS